MTGLYVPPAGRAPVGEFGTLQVGTPPDFLAVDASGHLTLHGNARAWDDLIRPAITARLQSPAGRITFDFDEGVANFQDNAIYPTDYLRMVIQIPHRWALQTDASPHFHWVQSAAQVPNWMFEYRWYAQGQLVPAGWTAVGPGTLIFTYTAGDLAQISGFADISGATFNTVSSFLDVKLYRDTTNVSTLFAGADPLVGDAALKEFDPHLLFDALGSDQEYVK